MTKNLNEKVAELYAKRASVIEDVMRLRYEQAQIKAQIVKLALETKDHSIIANMIQSW